VHKLKIDGYSANSALAAICFYTSDSFSAYTFVKAITYSVEDGEKVVEIPYGAKYFGCSKAKNSTNFKLSLLREGELATLKRDIKKNDNIHFYNKKVVIGGDSTTHGVGGTGFAQDGDAIATFKGNTYKRNPNGYCWTNLFKNLLETKYNATVTINACTGSNSDDWARLIATLLPTDTDIFILMIGTNDRVNVVGRTDYESIRTIMRDSFDSIKKYCDFYGIDFVLCSPAPTSAENEVLKNNDGSNTYAINICQIQEIIKEWAIDSNTKFRDTYTRLYDYYFAKGTDSIGTFADGLHPDDAMYYVIYHIYCSMFGVGATVPKLPLPTN
jgi:lysophospholipase L1-like esterase